MPPSARHVPLKPKQRHVALLSALLYDNTVIAETCGYSLQYVQQLLRRPEVRALVREHQEHQANALKDSVMADLMADAPMNLRRIKELRDQKDVPNVALSAAGMLFDRQVPKVTKTSDEKHIHIHLSREELEEGRRVLEEAQTIPMTDYQVESPAHALTSAR